MVVSFLSGQGSSPLTRGKLEQGAPDHVWPGLIPAHAGKTMIGNVMAGAAAAHPRSRGENAGSPACLPRTAGSSPLTRGKRRVLIFVRSNTRLIPAHAGKT